jgi:LacI family repressor for deo operon, udp, cdd, tsx, nupC, and nupG
MECSFESLAVNSGEVRRTSVPVTMSESLSRKRHASLTTATIRDVAKRAGVSTATVSRSLAAPDLVSEETRARVAAAITATGYTPNVAARNLRARRTKMVLVVVPNIANHFFAEVLRGIDDELVGHGYGIIIGNLDNLPEREARYVDLVFARQVDGVLLLSGHVPAGNGRTMGEAGLPMASICVEIPGSGLPAVLVDDRAAGESVAAHLLSLGHRRFGYVSGPAGNMSEVGRWGGFRAGMANAGFDPEDTLYWQGDFSLEAGIAAGHAFLDCKRQPTAIFAASDHMAIAFMKTVSEAGIRVPDDVSVVGFDGIEFGAFVTPTLTTIPQPRHELGHTAARMLLGALSGRETGGPIYVDAPLFVRDSTAPPSRACR